MTSGPGTARTPLPQGFLCSGVNSGVRRYRPDLGILTSDPPATTVGVFTLNQCKAAPILYSQKLLPSTQIRAVITNSGQANAATGQEGILNNLKMAQAVANQLECSVDQVLTASKGPIGVPLSIEKITNGISDLIHRLGTTAEPFALAILTTDLVPKTVSTQVQLESGPVQITGICKGSGMIHPRMGTMLGYFLTDALLSTAQAEDLLKCSVDKSFHMISVDGESSTNDCTFLLANGSSGIKITSSEDFISFQNALNEVATFLAKSIARDGEGATKLIEVHVTGSPNQRLAEQAARGLVTSPLVKTAIHGADPNWGRILARLGADQVPSSCLAQMALRLQNILVFDNGRPVSVDLQTIRRHLSLDTVEIHVDLKFGNHKATAWGCDLSKKYVEINAEYLT